jgi:hypothetical protein
VGDSAGFLLFLFLPPLAIAFALQLATSREKRHRLRRWVAGLWVALVAAVSTFGETGHWLGILLFAAMLLGLFFLLAYAGALLGSLAALRLKRSRGG